MLLPRSSIVFRTPPDNKGILERWRGRLSRRIVALTLHGLPRDQRHRSASPSNSKITGAMFCPPVFVHRKSTSLATIGARNQSETRFPWPSQSQRTARTHRVPTALGHTMAKASRL